MGFGDTEDLTPEDFLDPAEEQFGRELTAVYMRWLKESDLSPEQLLRVSHEVVEYVMFSE